MKCLAFMVLLGFLTLDLRAQVGDVTKGSRSNKERSKSGTSDRDSGSSSSEAAAFFFLEIFDVINLIGASQGAQLQKTI